MEDKNINWQDLKTAFWQLNEKEKLENIDDKSIWSKININIDNNLEKMENLEAAKNPR